MNHSVPGVRKKKAKTSPIPQLPPEIVARIFDLLPAEVRLQCREVSLAWRDFEIEEEAKAAPPEAAPL
jgi:hypothetical protein